MTATTNGANTMRLYDIDTRTTCNDGADAGNRDSHYTTGLRAALAALLDGSDIGPDAELISLAIGPDYSDEDTVRWSVFVMLRGPTDCGEYTLTQERALTGLPTRASALRVAALAG